MNVAARDLLKSTLEKLDDLLLTLPQAEQHDLLDELASQIEDRMVSVIESADE